MRRGNYDHNGSCLCCASFMRFLMIGINLIMAIVATAAIIIGLTMWGSVEAKLQSICASCRQMHIAYMCFFGAILCVSALGFLAIISRNILLRVVYVICLFVVFIAMLAICTLYIMIATDQLDLAEVWDFIVGREDDKLCDFELRLNCSGWRTLCRGQTTAAAPANCPKCTDQQQEVIDVFTTTCQTVVLQKFRAFAKFVLPLGFTVVLVALIGMLAACWARRREKLEQNL